MVPNRDKLENSCTSKKRLHTHLNQLNIIVSSYKVSIFIEALEGANPADFDSGVWPRDTTQLNITTKLWNFCCRHLSMLLLSACIGGTAVVVSASEEGPPWSTSVDKARIAASCAEAGLI